MTEQNRKIEKLGKARRNVLRTLQEGYKLFHGGADEQAKESAYASIYSAVWQYSDSYRNEYQCGSPLFSAAAVTNRYKAFAENASNPTISDIRKKTYAEFHATIDGFSPYVMPEFLTSQATKEEHAGEMTSFFLDLAINASSGFLTDAQNPQRILVADMLFEKGRQKYFNYERLWWEREVTENEKQDRKAVSEDMNTKKKHMRTMIDSLDQVALAAWQRFNMSGGMLSRLKQAAVEDFALRIEESTKMFGQLVEPEHIDLSFLTSNRS